MIKWIAVGEEIEKPKFKDLFRVHISQMHGDADAFTNAHFDFKTIAETIKFVNILYNIIKLKVNYFTIYKKKFI